MALRLLVAALFVLFPFPAKAVWNALPATTTHETRVVTTYTQTFAALGDLTPLDVSGCEEALLVSFDASVGDADTDASVNLYACDTLTETTDHCTPIRIPASGDALQEYTTYPLSFPTKVLTPRAETLAGPGDQPLLAVTCITYGTNPEGAGDAGDMTYTPADATDWADPDPTDVGEGLDKLADEKVSIADATSVTSGVGAPPATCASFPSCIYLQTDAGGAVLNIYCAIEDEAFGPCSPGLSAGTGTDSPIGNVSCEEAMCLYSETDAGIVWVSWTPGDAGWEAVYTEPTFTRYRFIISNWGSSAGARCLMHCSGCSAYLCSAAGGTGSGFPIKTYSAPRSTAHIRNIACELTAFTAPEADDNLEFQVVERDGSTAPVVATNKLTIAGNATIAGVVFSQDLDDPLTLTDDDSSIELRIYSPNDAGENSITDVDGYCTVMVEYGS